MKMDKQVLTIKDLFGAKADPSMMGVRVKELANWITKQSISNLPYVEIGFDALHEELIEKLEKQKSLIAQDYQSIKLNCKQYEFLQPSMLYQENFPYWCQPFSFKHCDDYRVGDRVMNINSSQREFVPFGIRGTVVGHTNDKVIILFDDQHLNGNNIYGHSEDFKGGYINPNYLVNLTHKFS